MCYTRRHVDNTLAEKGRNHHRPDVGSTRGCGVRRLPYLSWPPARIFHAHTHHLGLNDLFRTQMHCRDSRPDSAPGSIGACSTSQCFTEPDMSNDVPNILFIQCDQLTAAMLGGYGNAIASTPHLDALAGEGVVFESAYSNFPLCAPSRVSMLAGQLCSKIAAYDNAAEFPSSVPTVAHYLRWLGFQTSLVGKMHFIGADQLHGFEERLTTDIYPADFAFTGDWTDLQQKFANYDARSFEQAGVCVRNVQIDYDDEVAHRAERKLYDLKRSADERPFFMLVSFTHPHDPYQCPQEYWDRYPHDDVPLPAVGPAPDDQMSPHFKRLRTLSGLHSFEMTDDHLRNARHAYLGSVSFVDDQVGRLMRVLRNCDFHRNTVVVFTTDHGDMLGEHGLWYKKNFHEYSARIPLIVWSPERFQSARVKQKCFSHRSGADLDGPRQRRRFSRTGRTPRWTQPRRLVGGQSR